MDDGNGKPQQTIDHTKPMDSTSSDVSEESLAFTAPIPLRITVLVDDDVRRYLQMKNHERKAKLNLPMRLTEDQLTISYLRHMIEKQLPGLHQQPYVLRYMIPDTMIIKKTLRDEHILELFQYMSTNAKAIHFNIDPSPSTNFPLPPADKPYLLNMPDPSESETYSMVSFYTFYNITDPENLAQRLEEEWRYFGVVGRVYVATEGINAQMAIPTNIMEQFKTATLMQFECFNNSLYLNIDHLLSRNDFEETRPFKSLHIRVREQIVADGFDSGNRYR